MSVRIACCFFCQAEDGIRVLVRSRGLGDVYKRQPSKRPLLTLLKQARAFGLGCVLVTQNPVDIDYKGCLLYTSDAADERSSVDLGGRRIIKKKTEVQMRVNGGVQ